MTGVAEPEDGARSGSRPEEASAPLPQSGQTAGDGPSAAEAGSSAPQPRQRVRTFWASLTLGTSSPLTTGAVRGTYLGTMPTGE